MCVEYWLCAWEEEKRSRCHLAISFVQSPFLFILFFRSLSWIRKNRRFRSLCSDEERQRHTYVHTREIWKCSFSSSSAFMSSSRSSLVLGPLRDFALSNKSENNFFLLISCREKIFFLANEKLRCARRIILTGREVKDSKIGIAIGLWTKIIIKTNQKLHIQRADFNAGALSPRTPVKKRFTANWCDITSPLDANYNRSSDETFISTHYLAQHLGRWREENRLFSFVSVRAPKMCIITILNGSIAFSPSAYF